MGTPEYRDCSPCPSCGSPRREVRHWENCEEHPDGIWDVVDHDCVAFLKSKIESLEKLLTGYVPTTHQIKACELTEGDLVLHQNNFLLVNKVWHPEGGKTLVWMDDTVSINYPNNDPVTIKART
jgi:hypothetical protein